MKKNFLFRIFSSFIYKILKPVSVIFGYDLILRRMSVENLDEEHKIFLHKRNEYFFVTQKRYADGLQHVPVLYLSLMKELGLNFDFYNVSRCIDLGAHHGAFAFAIASIGIPTVAVEADPKNFSFLKANKAANPSLSVECIHSAVVSKEQTARSKFTEFFVGNSPTTGSVKPMFKSQKLCSGIAVPNIALADLFQLSSSSISNENIMLKVDVEGSEWLFFEDLINTLKSGCVAIFLGEFHDCDYEGQKYLIFESLKTLGWSYAVRDNDNGTLEIAAAPKKYCHNADILFS